MAITWTGAGVFGSIGKMIKEANASSVSPSSILSAMVSGVQSYINNNFRYLAEITYTNFNDIYWDGLVEEMVNDSESINGNAVTAGSSSFVGAGTGIIEDASGTGNQVSPTQMVLDDDTFRIACTSASAGNDSWSVYSMRRGQLSKTARTGNLYGEELTSDDGGGISFTILTPASAVANDGGSIIGDPTAIAITGGVKGTNCDADGITYIKVTESGGTYTFEGFISDAARTTGTTPVFSLTYTAIGDDKTITEENSSGLAGTINIDTLAVDADIEITLNIAYVAGDEFTVGACTSDDGGVIQTFFRNNFQKTLPYDISGAETIADSLAT